jgi:hypothetical protein
MGKTIYHIKAQNEDFSGFRNRAGKTLRFEFGEATTDKKAVAEYWDKQPGYTCVELAAPEKNGTGKKKVNSKSDDKTADDAEINVDNGDAGA